MVSTFSNHPDLYTDSSVTAYRSTLSTYFLEYEPELVRQRRSQRFRRKRFWAAGIMDMLCCDQHDKWKRFGLRLHNAVDPFVGKIHWIKIWYTNSDPVLITSYYLDDAEESGCELIWIPLSRTRRKTRLLSFQIFL